MTELEYLRSELIKINTYPSNMKPVDCEIPGVGFFPGARGLWNYEDETLSTKPIMILGHDFGAERDFNTSVQRGQENTDALTWKNLIKMLDLFEIAKEDCFFTNAIVGVRTAGSAIGKSPAYQHADFLNDCINFLIKQISVQKPKLIIGLGLHIFDMISQISPSLNNLKSIRQYKQLDEKQLSLIGDVTFADIADFKTTFVFVTHPTYYHLNASRRSISETSLVQQAKLLASI